MSRFFLDRSLGGKIVPAALRATGWDIVTMHEHYGKAAAQRVGDVEWINEMTGHGFALLSADHRILINPLEQEAILASSARAFILPTGNLTGAEMAARFELHRVNIERKAAGPGPAGFVVYEGYLSRVFP